MTYPECFHCGRQFSQNPDTDIWIALVTETGFYEDDGIAYKPYFDGQRFFCGCDEKEGWVAA